jgi:hypothetical protein
MKFEIGGKIEIFGDYFIVREVSTSEIFLKTKDPDLLLAKIIIGGKKNILVSERKINFKIEKKAFRFNGANYQIMSQEHKEEYDGDKWTQIVLNEVQLVGKKDKFQRKIISKVKEGGSFFYNWEELKEEDIIFNPIEKFEKNEKINNKKIKIKIEDLP